MEDFFLTPFARALAAAVVAGVLLAAGDYVIGLVLVAVAIGVFALDLRRFRSSRLP